MASKEGEIRLKLFIDKCTKEVIYAEAGKDFVDFLVHTFMKPLGLAMKQDFDGAFPGGLGNLYTSVANDLSGDYLQSGATTKAAFLNPNLLKTFYVCSKCKSRGQTRLTDGYGATCPKCTYTIQGDAVYDAPPYNNIPMGHGYVNGLLTYNITDDLVIKPLSTSLNMTLLSQHRIKDISRVQETEVILDPVKGMELIKTSLTSKKVLTDT